MIPDRCKVCRNEVVWWGMAANTSMMVFKAVLGILAGSAALVADSFHSGADVVADWVTIASVKASNRAPDRNFPYGVGNIQYISSSVVGLILFFGAMALMFDSVTKVMAGAKEAPSFIAAIGALVSVVTNEIMFRYEICAGNTNNSPALIAVAWDNRSDAISSTGVLVGIIIAIAGFPIADAVAAVVVSLMVAHIGIDLNVQAFKGLMDSSVDTQVLEKVYKIAVDMPRVQGVRFLRGRTVGELIYIDMNVFLDGGTKIFESDFIVEAIREGIMSSVAHVTAVRVGTTPYPGEAGTKHRSGGEGGGWKQKMQKRLPEQITGGVQ